MTDESSNRNTYPNGSPTQYYEREQSYDGDYVLSVEWQDHYMFTNHSVVRNPDAIEEGATLHFEGRGVTLIPMAALHNTMTDDPTGETLGEAFAYLRKMTRLSGAIVSASRGDADALADLQEPRTIEAEFPGEKDRALGGALYYVEDLNELEGVSAEREYVESTENGHRIDLHLNGGNE